MKPRKWMLFLMAALLLIAPLFALAEEEDDPALPVDQPEVGEEAPSASPEGQDEPSASPDVSESPSTSPSADPSADPTAEPTAEPVSEPLAIDTATLYEGMQKTYEQGYVPTVENNTATVILPLLGATAGNVIRVTPSLSTDGPYVYGNYQFDVRKEAVQAVDQTMHEVFLVRLDLPLKADRYNGTYAIPFAIEYTGVDGAAAQQTFTVQLTIADGKNRSNGGGGGPSTVRKPVLLVTDSTLTPAEAAGGDTVRLMLTVANQGNYDATNIRIQLSSSTDALQLKTDLNAHFYDGLKVGKSLESEFELYCLPGSSEGSGIVTVYVTYEDRYGGMYSDQAQYRIAVTQPKIEIVACEYSEVLGGGEDFTAKLTVKNTGSRDAADVSVRFVQQDVSIRLKGVTDTVYLDALKQGDSAEVSFDLRALPSASEGKHGLKFVVAFRDGSHLGAFEAQSDYEMTVVQKATLGYDDVRLPESIVSGQSFTQPVCVYNTGFAPIYNVRCSLDCDGLICSSAFLGNLAPQQSADKTITVFVTTLSGSQKYGTTYGTFHISYEDADGNKFSEVAAVQMSITEPEQKTDAEREKELQKIEEQHLLSQWWVSILIGIAIICILIAALVISKFMRMLKMK